MLYIYEKVIFAVHPPNVLATNEHGRLHCTTGPALSFNDNTKRYFINGRNIPSRIVEQTHKITRESFLKQENSDTKGAIYEVLGQNGMFKLSLLDILLNSWFRHFDFLTHSVYEPFYE